MYRIKHKAQKALAVVAMAVGAISVPAAPAYAADGWKANDDDALLLDIRSRQYRLGDGVRGYQTPSGVCVDLADIIMAFDLPVRLDKKSRRATGWLFEEARTFTLDRELNRVQIVNKTEKLSLTAIRDTPEGWCADVKSLARWLDVDLVPDLQNALLLLKAERKLPFELSEERKKRAGRLRSTKKVDLSEYPQADDPYRFFRMPSVDAIATATTRRDRINGQNSNFSYELYASGEIAGASFDARLSSNNSAFPETLRLRAYRTDPQGRLLGPLKATHFALGDVSTISTPLGIQSTAGRGAFITNRPLERSDNFDQTTFRGELPVGWDAELYRNDQLIGYTQGRGDGRFEFLEVPLLFGQNRFEIVLYGPQGQVKRDVRLIPVGLDSIPPRETYYWAALQDAGRDLINFSNPVAFDNFGWRGSFGIERGINAKTSLAASYSTSLFKGLRRHYLEGSVRRALGPALVELATASNLRGGYALKGQLLAQIGQTNISAQGALLGGGFQSERYKAGLRRQLRLSLDHSFKIGRSYIPLHIEAEHEKDLRGGSLLEVASRLSFNIKRITASAEMIWVTRKAASGSDPPDRFDAALRLSGRLGGIRLRGEARFGLTGRDRGFQNSRFTAERRLSERSDWRVQLSYDAPTSRGVLGAGLTRRFEKFALTGQVELGSDGSLAAGLNLAFSFGPDPRGGGIRFSSEKLASSGQALAIVWHDRNGDGIRQADEPVEKDVELTAGLSGRGPPTDDRGQTLLDDLQPFKPVLIGIDTSSLPDPFVQPASSGVVITPRPGVPLTVELPLVSAGEVAGTLKREDGKLLSGVDIELLDKEGRVVKNTRSEYDGFFLFESIPYGKYSLRIGSLSASIVGVDPNVTVIAELNNDNPTAEVGVVVARHAVRIAAAAGE
ncbi:MAG: carboxypeptidase regulatory-like domain-containing protein [Sphingorhabdus sp.]